MPAAPSISDHGPLLAEAVFMHHGELVTEEAYGQLCTEALAAAGLSWHRCAPPKAQQGAADHWVCQQCRRQWQLSPYYTYRLAK